MLSRLRSDRAAGPFTSESSMIRAPIAAQSQTLANCRKMPDSKP
jgi:hypothetical protein